MASDTLAPAEVLAEWKTGNLEDLVEMGISAARKAHYERGLVFLAEAYRHLSREKHRLSGPLLSFYGLCLALHRPYNALVPGFVTHLGARLLLGEMAQALLLEGAFVYPRKLEAAGFAFRFPNAEAALADLL